MEVKTGEGKTEYGPGVDVILSGDDVATAIDAYLVAHGIHVSGPRTITVNGNLCERGRVYVDPSGFVIADGTQYAGRFNDPHQPVAGTGLPFEEPRPATRLHVIVMPFTITEERAKAFAYRVLPRGTKLSSVRLRELRETIAKEVEYLMRIQDEHQQMKDSTRPEA